MNEFYFFKNDGRCRFMKKVIGDHFNKYLIESGNNAFDNKIKYYLNLEWTGSNEAGVSIDYLVNNRIRYINTIDELPQGSGIYISTYDGDLNKIKDLQNKNIPLIYNGICPWATAFKKQLLKVPDSHQCILLIDEKHLLLKNYRSIVPQQTIVINDTNYKEKINEYYSGKPVYFIAYATFRKKDAERVIEFLNAGHHHSENIFFTKTLCSWITHQGLFEEIQERAEKKELNEIWILCSDNKNRSARSIINEIQELNIRALPISSIEDIPEKTIENKKIGILIAPVPFSKEKELLSKIKEIFNLNSI